MTYFSFTDSGDAYDACQCNDDLTTGTVLKVRDDSYYGRATGRDEDGFRVREFSEPISVTIIGLAWAWPIAVTVEAGEFHGIEEDTGAYARVIADAGFTREQIAEAVAIADSLSAPVRPMFRMWLAAQADTTQREEKSQMSRNLSMYSTTRLRNVLEFVTENDNGDAGMPALVADINAEIERRRATYRLGSSGLVNTPGFLRTLLHAYGVPSDRAWSLNVLTEGWGLSKAAAIALLSKAVPFKVEGDAVVFDYVREEA